MKENLSTSRELAIRRAEYIKKLKIKVRSSEKTSDEDQLILIETFNTEKNCWVELVMRRLSELDSLIAHMNKQYGGHIIPVFSFDLFYQEKLEIDELVPAIQEYFYDLRNNKYCRQDAKFYCFLIEQHTAFPKQMGFERLLSNATDMSRKYLNGLFTRRNKEKCADVLLYAENELKERIEQYYEVKTISLLKAQENIVIDDITSLLTEMSAWPGIAQEPQEHDIDFIWNTIKSAEKLIEQANQAFIRWEVLVDNVRDLQSNVYKGLHEYEAQFEVKNKQLQEWSETLTREFNDLADYLEDKMEALAGEAYKVNSKCIDMIVFSGQGIITEDDLDIESKGRLRIKSYEEFKGIKGYKINREKVEELHLNGSYEINEEIIITNTKPPELQKYNSLESIAEKEIKNVSNQQNAQIKNIEMETFYNHHIVTGEEEILCDD